MLLLVFAPIDLVITPLLIRFLASTPKHIIYKYEGYGLARYWIIMMLIVVWSAGALAFFGMPPRPHRFLLFFAILLLILLGHASISLLSAFTKDKNPEIICVNNLDCIMGLLVYPSSSLQSDKMLYDYRDQPVRLTVSAFLFPEYWYLYREILGAGFLAWAQYLWLPFFGMLLSYMGLGELSFYLPLAALLAIRVFSGLNAHRIYYARYGRLPG